jgi:NAD(P)-dependent dehydrogenase (short-subunit alcohol dehydrogenase family)
MAGKVALVTGGASGIGRAAAVAFARAGAKVVVSDVDAAGSAETIQLLGGGSGGIFVKTDVTRTAEVEELMRRAAGAWGRLDYAFNNAGIQGDVNTTADCTEENWDRIIGTNLKGVWLCMKFEILHMLRTGGGAIVNTASNFGLVGSSGMPAYSASKHGVVGLTKTAALEYAKSGIRVNAVCPGPTQTPLVEKVISGQPELGSQITESILSRLPAGRWGRAEEIAQAAVWLCSDAASFVTGAALPVDGGYVTQ